MVDFLKLAKKVATETITVAGMKVEVRGLTLGALRAITKPNKAAPARDPVAFTIDLVAACCYGEDGKRLVPDERKDEIADIAPSVFKVLSEAVARVNGLAPGNSKATGADASLSA